MPMFEQKQREEFDTWKCHTCHADIDRSKGEAFDDWQERIFQHWNEHPNPAKRLSAAFPKSKKHRKKRRR